MVYLRWYATGAVERPGLLQKVFLSEEFGVFGFYPPNLTMHCTDGGHEPKLRENRTDGLTGIPGRARKGFAIALRKWLLSFRRWRQRVLSVTPVYAVFSLLECELELVIGLARAGRNELRSCHI